MNVTRGQFESLLFEHCERTGFTGPELLMHYLVDLLDSRLQRVDIIPDPSFGERYMLLLQDPRAETLKDYADSCLFFTSLCPEWVDRRGISRDYLCTLGISSYYTAGDLAGDDRMIQLGNWFYTLQKLLHTAVRPEVRLELFRF